MAEEFKEHDLFSEEFEAEARRLLEDTEFAKEPPKPEAPGKQSIDDINALLLSVGLSPIERDASAPAAEPDPLEKTRHFETAAAPEADDGKTRHFTPPAAKKAPPKPTFSTGQMVLDGYDDEDAPRRVNEAEVEAQLQESRRNLVENFRVLQGEREDNTILEKQATGEGANSVFDALEVREGEPLFDAVEKADKKTLASLKKLGARAVQTVQQIARADRRTVQLLDARVTKESLAQARARVKKQTIVLGVLFALSLLLNLFGAFYTPGGALEFLFGHGARLFTCLNLLLFAGGVLTVLRDVRDGLQTLRQKSWNYHAMLFVLDAAVLLHTLIVLAFGMDESTGFVSFSLCALFLSLVEYAGNLVRLHTVQGDLAVMMHAGQLQGLRPIENEADAAALGSGFTDKARPQILLSADVPALPDSDALTAQTDPHGKLYFYGTAAAFLVAFAFALARAILQKNALLFFSSFLS